MASEIQQNPDACYLALRTRDARFDGRFFVGVTSTGIYCRPVCRVRTPRAEHCRFFRWAAQAELAGFRPCLRCRPELAPADRYWSSHDAGDRLMSHALDWLDDPARWLGDDAGPGPLVRLTSHLGITDRHLRRLFASQVGMTPLQYLQTRRLLTAKLLLTDTRLPMAEVAQASGFSSLRRFNDVFVQSYGMTPSRLRQSPDGGALSESGMRAARLAWRPPMHLTALLGFLKQRELAGNECLVDGPQPVLIKAVHMRWQGRDHAGWVRARFAPAQGCVWVDVSPSLQALLPLVIRRVRHWFDLDTDTTAIDALLEPDFPSSAGIRLPGCFDGFETAVRAILGQQVTLRAANTLAARLSGRLGAPVTTPVANVNRLFPTPECLASVDPATLGELGVTRQRQTAIIGLARACAQGELRLDPGAEPGDTLRRLGQVPGIGPWTSAYVAMRALRVPDAWPSGDAGLRNALTPPGQTDGNTDLQGLSERWRPWRSYAAIRAWATLATDSATEDTP
ncbi:MAG: Ada metal-binding domain-containing protein [Burkholderiaceae bacterium]